jgi:hypothetical protein
MQVYVVKLTADVARLLQHPGCPVSTCRSSVFARRAGKTPRRHPTTCQRYQRAHVSTIDLNGLSVKARVYF